MKTKIKFKFTALIALVLSLVGCGGKLTFDLPNLLRGQWVMYENNTQYAKYQLDLGENGKYKEKKESNDNSTSTSTTGTYTYSYTEFNFSTPSGTIILNPDNSSETFEYSFDEKLNSTNGQVALTLIRQTTEYTEKLELNYNKRESLE